MRETLKYFLRPEKLRKQGCKSLRDFRRCDVSIPNPLQCSGCPNWTGIYYDSATDNSPPGTRGGESPQRSHAIRIEREKNGDPSLGA